MEQYQSSESASGCSEFEALEYLIDEKKKKKFNVYL